jgi:hypothetical protein
MASHSYHFDVLPYVPRRFVFGSVFLFVGFLGLVTAVYWLIAIGFLLSILCLTTFYKVEVNTSEKWFKEYVWVLGIKSGERVKYGTIDYLFVNKGLITETTSSRIQSTTVTREEYRGFIKFDNNEKIHILTNTNRDRLVTEMTGAARNFQSRLFDYSSGQTTQLA